MGVQKGILSLYEKFLAYYYNRGVEWDEEVCVFYKYSSIFDGCAIYDVERGQIDGVAKELWQNDTAIAKILGDIQKQSVQNTERNCTQYD